MVQKTSITKLSPTLSEHGIQIRENGPLKPVEDQLWQNVGTGKLNYYKGTLKELFSSYVEGARPASIINVAGTAIDWSAGSTFKKIATGANAMTFTNAQDGMTRYLVLLASPSNTATITWPAGTKLASDDGDAYTMAIGRGLIIRMTYVQGVYFLKVIYRAESVNAWPLGTMGNLVINNGETVSINAGSILDYDNVTINAGGVLSIVGNSLAITQLGVRNNLIINGTIRNQGYLGTGASYSVVTPDGTSISHTVAQAQAGGGAGGNGPGARPGGTGGSLGYGGGGGGAGGPGSGGYGAPGGQDNAPGNNYHGSAGGIGNYTLGNGENGGVQIGGNGGGSGGGGSNYGGSGGGGGYKGAHGRGLYIYCKGVISGAGQIDCGGGNGFNGGNGGPKTNSHGTGGGAGGGAGGNGGALWVRKPSASPFTVPYNVAGGQGGFGGTGAGTGANGASGNAGTYSLGNN